MMQKNPRSWFEKGIDAVEHMTPAEQIALAKYLAAQIPEKLFTAAEVERMLTELVTGQTELYKEANPELLLPLGTAVEHAV